MKINLQGRFFILHPFLLAIYPVLSIYAANSDRLKPSFMLRPLFLSLLLSFIVLGLFQLVLRDWRQAGLVTSLFLLLFFTYGHVYTLLEGEKLAGFAVGRHRVLLILWISAFLVGSWLIWKRLDNVEKATSIVNTVAIVALLFPFSNLLIFNLRQLNSASAGVEKNVTMIEQNQVEWNAETLPDIYYIILDAYGRQDVLQRVYGYDNSAFLGELKNLGFTVADESRANYGQTVLSITSALNMDYVQNLVEELDSKQSDYVQMLPFIRQSLVRSLLESYGYQTIAFSTGDWITELDDADLYLEPDDSGQEENVLGSVSKIGKVNPFEVMLVQSTAAVLITDYVSHCVAELDAYQASTPEERSERGAYTSGLSSKVCVLFEGLYETLRYPFREHRERIQFVLDTLPELTEISEPHFVFAHIIAPHFPFVFGPQGEVGSYLEETDLPFWYFTGTHEAYIQGYVGQITYVNKRVQEIMRTILSNSDKEPIIIIQADHGPDSTMLEYEPPAEPYLSERFPILNAYYLPSYCKQDQLYRSITPVNSYRAIFNACFGTDYELLEDRSYWSFYDKPYQLDDVTDQIKP